jgi:glycosyltransferase involved in cell wall biosynthesis
MRIALLGTRGIPANYGGFETFAEELSTRLTARGHRVTVYCRTNNVGRPGKEYRGVRLALLPTIPHKYFDTLAHTFFSTLHLLLRRFDIVLYCNGANAVFTPLPRLVGMPTVLNVDGLERQRRKWNFLARGWYRFSERLATWFPSAVVSDAKVIQQYYAETYRKPTHCIAYGADIGKVQTAAALAQWSLQPGEYFLYVSRMEPENNALLVVRAFERTTVGKKLVMVGDAPYAEDYIRQVKQTRDPRILFTGAVYGQGYRELQSHCFAYIHATEVGGTHPALIEAMGRGCLVLYLDTAENREVAGNVGVPYPHDEKALAHAIESAAGLPDEKRQQMGCAAIESARRRYDWEAVVDSYEKLFTSLANRAARVSKR